MHPAGSFGSAAFLLPALVAAEAGRLTSLFAQSMAGLVVPAEGGRMRTRIALVDPEPDRAGLAVDAAARFLEEHAEGLRR